MAASTVQNPAAQSESKSSKKKKAKAEAAAPPTAVPAREDASTPTAESSNGDGAYESPYIKELYKSIRNVNKKIANASKVDNILAENPTKSLDELVASRKINADQKAQILKKPALQSSLTQLEEQISQYKKFDAEYKSKAQAEKAELEKTFTEKAEKNLSEALAAVRAEAVASAAKEQHENMLVLSQFLRLAAARRADEEADTTLDENLALEGVLLQVYSGDETAVNAIIKLVSGADEPTFSTTGEQLTTTYGSIKATAVAQAPPALLSEDVPASEPNHEVAEYPVGSDPTVANAGMTELEDTLEISKPVTNDHADPAAEMASVGIAQNAGIDEGASNAAAESHWDISESQEWVDVKVPRDISETDTGLIATPAEGQAPQETTSSWAEETNDAVAPVKNDDGFHEVQGRSKSSREGQHRGRGGRGGEHRGGRGGYRGGEGGYRGGRGRGGARGGPREGGAPRQPRPAQES